MNRKIVFHLIFVITALLGCAVMFSGVVGWLMHDPVSLILRMFSTGLILFLISVALVIYTRPRGETDRKFGLREGFAIVALAWFTASLAGALPYITVAELRWYDAVFESTSGLSTTGATLIDSDLLLRHGEKLKNGIESLPYTILFWRCLTQWFGGMGIVVLTIAILPLLHIGGQALYNAEMTGVKSMGSKIAPRIASTAKVLWLVYLALTAAEAVLLYLGGMTFFDSVCHSFTTVAAGGFSTKTDSIAHFNSTYIDGIVTLFMFLAGCNFALHLRGLTGKVLDYWKNEECRFYFFLILISTLIITTYLFLFPVPDADFTGHAGKSFHAAVFQVVSIITSTGFTTTDYAKWPTACCAILFILMFIGGCGGSTAGGMKCVRAMILHKHSIAEVRRCIFPRLLPNVRLNGTRLEGTVIQRTIGFFALFFGIFLSFVILIPLVCPMDFATAVSVSISSLSNIGPGFAQIGPAFTYSWMTPAAKLLLSFEMILGRLELFTVLVLFLPSFWKK